MEEKQTILAAAFEGFLDSQKQTILAAIINEKEKQNRAMQVKIASLSSEVFAKNVSIAEKEAQLLELGASMQSAVATKEIDIAALASEISAKNATITEKENELADMQASMQQALIAKEAEMTSLIATKDSELAHGKSALEKTFDKIKSMKAELIAQKTDSEAAIAALVSDVSAKNASIAEKEAQLLELGASMQSAVAAKEAEIAALTSDLTEKAAFEGLIPAANPAKQDSLQGLMLQPSSSSLHAHINEVGKASAGAAAATTKTEKRSSLFSRQPVKKVASAITRAIIKPSRFSFISANKQFRRFTVSGSYMSSYMSNIDTNTTEQKILNSNPESQSQKANPKLAKSIFLGSIERARTAALHTSLPITNDDPM